MTISLQHDLHKIVVKTYSSTYIFYFIVLQACGFEILVAQAKPSVREKQVQNGIDLEGDRRWFQYLNSLKKTGYFKV